MHAVGRRTVDGAALAAVAEHALHRERVQRAQPVRQLLAGRRRHLCHMGGRVFGFGTATTDK
jgi:hypothetical protein